MAIDLPAVGITGPGHYTWAEEWGTHRRAIMSGPFATEAEAAADLPRARSEWRDKCRAHGTSMVRLGLCCYPPELRTASALEPPA